MASEPSSSLALAEGECVALRTTVLRVGALLGWSPSEVIAFAEALTGYRMAQILEKVLGRPVTYIPADARQFDVIMSLLGVPETPREHVIKIFKMAREHRLDRVHDTLEKLGIRPVTYEQ